MRTVRTFASRYPVLAFYALVFAISWGGMLLLVGPTGIPGSGEQVTRLFVPALLILFAGPSIAGVVMTGLVSGRSGYREFLSRLARWRVSARWYAAALLPGPMLVAAVLLVLSRVSPGFIPGIVTAGDRAALIVFGLAWGLVGGGCWRRPAGRDSPSPSCDSGTAPLPRG